MLYTSCSINSYLWPSKSLFIAPKFINLYYSKVIRGRSYQAVLSLGDRLYEQLELTVSYCDFIEGTISERVIEDNQVTFSMRNIAQVTEDYLSSVNTSLTNFAFNFNGFSRFGSNNCEWIFEKAHYSLSKTQLRNFNTAKDNIDNNATTDRNESDILCCDISSHNRMVEQSNLLKSKNRDLLVRNWRHWDQNLLRKIITEISTQNTDSVSTEPLSWQ